MLLFDSRLHSRQVYCDSGWHPKMTFTCRAFSFKRLHVMSFLWASGVSRAPNFFRLPAHHQFAVIGQLKTAPVALRPVGVCCPPGSARLVVHDQVAIRLHAQTENIWCVSVWSPHNLWAIDDKVPIILQAETEASGCYQNVHLKNTSLKQVE